jgi:hypothetical protein
MVKKSKELPKSLQEGIYNGLGMSSSARLPAIRSQGPRKTGASGPGGHRFEKVLRDNKSISNGLPVTHGFNRFFMVSIPSASGKK